MCYNYICQINTHMTLWLCATDLILSCANYITVQIKIIVVCAHFILQFNALDTG